MTSVVKLVQIIGVSLERSLEVIQDSKQDQHWGHTRLSRAFFSWVQMPSKLTSCFWVPVVMFFILWVNNVFLVSRWNYFYFTILSSCHAALWRTCLCWLCLPAELPPPPGYPCVWGKGSHCFPPAPGRASVGTAQHAVGFPCCLTFNLPKARSCVKLGLTFLSLRHPAAHLLYHEVYSWKSGILLKLIAHRAKISESKGNRNNPCEIPRVKFSAGGVSCN